MLENTILLHVACRKFVDLLQIPPITILISARCLFFFLFVMDDTKYGGNQGTDRAGMND